MQTLEILFNEKIPDIIFFERKITITNSHTILYGAKLTGKTYLIYDYIKSHQNKPYLYIDIHNLKDLIFEPKHLDGFISKNNIEILIIENYDYSFKIPNLKYTLISTQHYQPIDKFDKLEVLPLDFEEYLSFDKKHQNSVNSFNNFLKYGNLAQTIEYKDIYKNNRNNEIIKLISENEKSYQILKLLIKNSGQIKSPFLLFTILKKNTKISKDFFYNYIKKLEHNNIILSCPKYKKLKGIKKIFCYNHGFINSVTYNKNFYYIYSTIIFLELYSKYKNIYYTNEIDFYLEDEKIIILCVPFYNNKTIETITTKILKSLEELECNKIYIVTISNNDSLYIDDIPCEILPFYQWALIN